MSSACGVSLWKFIRSNWLIFSKLLQYDVGNETRVKFWEHVVVWALLRRHSQNFTVLVRQGCLQLRRLCVFFVGRGSIGMLSFVIQCMIGN